MRIVLISDTHGLHRELDVPCWRPANPCWRYHD